MNKINQNVPFKRSVKEYGRYNINSIESVGLVIGKSLEYVGLISGISQILEKDFGTAAQFGLLYLAGYCIESIVNDDVESRRFKALEDSLKQK